jgi:hypothetical protein
MGMLAHGKCDADLRMLLDRRAVGGEEHFMVWVAQCVHTLECILQDAEAEVRQSQGVVGDINDTRLVDHEHD